MSASITKRAITLSFFKLLETKPYKKITVSDVTDTAGVNRMTFYYHFKDIDDLVIKTIEEVFLDICTQAVNKGDYSSLYLDIYLIVARHKNFAKKIFPEFDMHRLLSFITPLAFRLAGYIVKQRGAQIPKEMTDGIVHSVACCMVGSFFEWLNSDMEKDPHEIVKGQQIFFNATLNGIAKKNNKKSD